MDSVFDLINIVTDFSELNRLENVFYISILVALYTYTQFGFQNRNLFAGNIVDPLLIEQNLEGVAQQLLLFYRGK